MIFSRPPWQTDGREGSMMKEERNDNDTQQTAEGAWQLFCRTGLPQAYLMYAFEKEEGGPQ